MSSDHPHTNQTGIKEEKITIPYTSCQIISEKAWYGDVIITATTETGVPLNVQIHHKKH